MWEHFLMLVMEVVTKEISHVELQLESTIKQEHIHCVGTLSGGKILQIRTVSKGGCYQRKILLRSVGKLCKWK